MATERVCFERFIPNSPRKLSVPTAVRSMTIMPFMNERAAIEQGALGQQVAGRVPPDVARVGGQVEQLVARRRRRSRPARRSSGRPRAGCRRGCGRAATPSWASAQWRVAPSPMTACRCWNATVVGGSSWRLATASLRVARRGRPRASRRRATGPPSGSASGPDATSSSTTVAVGASPSAMNVRVMSARSGAPAAQRTTIGRVEPDARPGRRARRPGSRARGSSWANLSSAGRIAPPSSSARTRCGSRPRASANVVERDARARSPRPTARRRSGRPRRARAARRCRRAASHGDRRRSVAMAVRPRVAELRPSRRST